MKRLFFPFSIVLFAALGCASPVKTAKHEPAKDTLLFPYGKYVHEVKIQIPENPDPARRTFEFRGAVKIAPDAIHIVVLSPIGTTLFKLSEDRATGKITTGIYASQLKPYEAKLEMYYSSLRTLLTMLRRPEGPGIIRDPEGRPLSLETRVADRPTKFTFMDYDEHQIPTTLRIESPNFSIDVKVVGYEI